MVFRVAVLGASQATGFGLAIRPDVPRRTRAFPGVLNADPSGDFEIHNWSRDGRNIDDYIARLDEVVEWRPDVVLFMGGGRESLVRRNRFVARCRRPIPVKGIAHTPRYSGVERIKTVPWRVVVWLLNRNSATIERLAPHVGFGPEVPTAQYVVSLTELMARVMAETTAHVVTLDGLWGWQGEYAWWEGERSANHQAARDIAATNPRVSTLSCKELVESPGYWLPDGAHLNEAGHAVIARRLAEEIRRLSVAAP